MKILFRISLLCLLASCFCMSGVCQDKSALDPNADTRQRSTSSAADTKIPRNSKVYIAPMDGFEVYLAAAFRKKEVPLIIVTQRDNADFMISGSHEKKNAGWAKTIFLGDARDSASASMQV